MPGAQFPTNIGEADFLAREATALVVDKIDSRYGFWVFDTDNGFITAYVSETLGTSLQVIRNDADHAGIPFVGFSTSSSSPNRNGLGVFVVNSLRVAEDAAIVGVGLRPLVIYSQTTIAIEGRVLVDGGMITREGLLPAGVIDQGTSVAATDGGGGNGGSFGTSGGSGGSPAAIPKAETYGSPELSPLLAGSSGADTVEEKGGKGGGAVHLVAAMKITSVAGAVVSAGGGGGRGNGASTCDGGSGGGSGGAILIEAPTVELAGFFTANGGGGGAGCGFHGEHGGTTAPAAGAASNMNTEGGDGSDFDGVAEDGKYNAELGTGGGGGGGAGRIRINTTVGRTEFPEATFSPLPSTKLTTFGTIAPR